MSSNDTDFILETAETEIYRKNAFRIIGLPTDASPREITRRSRTLITKITHEKIGLSDSPFPLDPPPNEDEIRLAADLLRDPEKRLVEEFFWFWPDPSGRGKNDEALASLSQGDAESAVRNWEEKEGKGADNDVSKHNLAIYRHLNALDMEHQALNGGLTVEEVPARDRHWRSIWERWNELIEKDGIWDRLNARIEELNDPRLTQETIRNIRESLPPALLSINAKIALRYAQKGARLEVLRHRRILESAPFDKKSTIDALNKIVNPFYDNINILCNRAEQEAESNPSGADGIAEDLFKQTHTPLKNIHWVLPKGELLKGSSYDKVASAASTCIISYGNKTNNWSKAFDLLENAWFLAAGETTQSRLDKNLKILKKNMKADRGVRYSLQPEKPISPDNHESWDPWKAWEYSPLPDPLIDRLMGAKPSENSTSMDSSISNLIPMVFGNDSPFEESYHFIAAQCLAHCLNLRAEAALNSIFDRVNTKKAKGKNLKEEACIAYADLLEADDLDPENESTERYIRCLNRFCKDCRIKLQLPAVKTLHFPQDKGLLNPDSTSETCYFCNERDSEGEATDIRLKMHGNVDVISRKIVRIIQYDFGVVRIPRCEACREKSLSFTEPDSLDSESGAKSPLTVLKKLLGFYRKTSETGEAQSYYVPMIQQKQCLEHPEVQKLMAEGWKTGEKPGSAEIGRRT